MSIKVITKPSVYLIGRPNVVWGSVVELMESNEFGGWTSDAESADMLPEIGGRLCYMSFGKPRPGGNKAYIKHILEAGHGSVLEHANFTFIFEGVSRSLTHELVRHRAGMAYSQLSQRYVDESDVAFVLPPAIPEGMDANAHYVWRRGCMAAIQSYIELSEDMEDLLLVESWKNAGAIDCPGMDMDAQEIDHATKWAKAALTGEDKTARRKKAREAARSLLPNCTETKIQVTGNCRAWRNFLEQRGAEGADAEIRRLALTVLPILNAEAPAIFGDYSVETNADGIDHITTPHRKV